MDLRAKLERMKASAAPTGARAATSDGDATDERTERIRRLRDLLSGVGVRKLEKNERGARSRFVWDGEDDGCFSPLAGARSRGARGTAPLARAEDGISITTIALEPDHAHGAACVRMALEVAPEIIAKLALDARFEGVDARGLLFLDTETTGLAGGAGTIPFLVGMAWFEGASLVIEQLLLSDLASENAILERVRERVARAASLASYNGKAFDWPLLETRFVLNRMPSVSVDRHFDLLHVARRAFRARLGRVPLVAIEREILGMRREGDVEGFEIPSIYWAYLRGEDDGAMHRVLEHNRSDLIALAALLGFLGARYGAVHVEDDPRDHLALAKMAMRARDADRALAFARAAFSGGGDTVTTVEACLVASRVHSRRREFDACREILALGLECVAGEDFLAMRLHFALAKVCEHRLRDFDRALVHARWVLRSEPSDANLARVVRLEAKCSRG